MKADDLQYFKKKLEARRMLLAGEVNNMENEALKKSRQDASGDLSNMPIHMADIGSDNYEQEFMLGLIENGDEELREIDEALERIENGDFGRCQSCQQLIPKTRLKAIPYAKLCIECKREEELDGPNG